MPPSANTKKQGHEHSRTESLKSHNRRQKPPQKTRNTVEEKRSERQREVWRSQCPRASPVTQPHAATNGKCHSLEQAVCKTAFSTPFPKTSPAREGSDGEERKAVTKDADKNTQKETPYTTSNSNNSRDPQRNKTTDNVQQGFRNGRQRKSCKNSFRFHGQWQLVRLHPEKNVLSWSHFQS